MKRRVGQGGCGLSNGLTFSVGLFTEIGDVPCASVELVRSQNWSVFIEPGTHQSPLQGRWWLSGEPVGIINPVSYKQTIHQFLTRTSFVVGLIPPEIETTAQDSVLEKEWKHPGFVITRY